MDPAATSSLPRVVERGYWTFVGGGDLTKEKGE
jgi:hypothetical protein